jgi:subtilisin family serine protease
MDARQTGEFMILCRNIFVVLLLVQSVEGHASRWILKNPKVLGSEVHVLNRIDLGKTKLVVVESLSLSADQKDLSVAKALNELTQADLAIPDLKLGLNVIKTKAAKPAWHVERMQYNQIPAGLDGAGIVVAVLDSGVDYNHVALKDHIWTNTKEIAGNGIDDDRNGYIDDVRGWNFSGKNNDPKDGRKHGTHCAGIIAADTQVDGQARGVAQGVKIMPLRILDSVSTGFLSDAASAIRYAVDNGAHVMSNSWRVYKSSSSYYNEEGAKLLGEALAYAESKNVLFVAAAGNETVDLSNNMDPIYPAGMEGHANLVVVAATNDTDNLADFTNYGKTVVHVAAPGEGITSTVPGNSWKHMSGTSMATPLVAGVLALGLQKNLSPEESVARLMTSSENKTTWSEKIISGGLINILNYLK